MKPFAFGEQSEPFTQIDSRDRYAERQHKHRTCEPRSASETKTTLFVSESECQAGSLTERHFKGCKILKKQIKYIGYIELKGDYNGSYACSKNIADAHGRRNP